jgi:hypothetical protein
MKDNSNKTIVALLAIALVITVVGTVVSVSKLNEFGGMSNQLSSLTGAATISSTEQTNITITSATSITLANTSMNFGSGRVNSSCSICGMDSNNTVLNYWSNGTITGGGAGESNGCCTTFNRVTAGFLIENTGNVNVSVGYTCSGNCTFDTFIGGSFGPAGNTMNPLSFEINAQNVRKQVGETGSTDNFASCAGGGTLYRDSGWNVTNSSSYTNTIDSSAGTNIRLSSSGHWLCGNYTNSPLDSSSLKNAAVFDVNISIPSSAPDTGVQSSFTLTFNATSQ